MPNATIQSGSLCAGGNHRIVVTSMGTVKMLEENLQSPAQGMDEIVRSFEIVFRHKYLERRAAGRTHQQALTDQIGTVVYL